VLTLTKGGPGKQSTVLGMMIYQSFSFGFYGRATAMGMLLSAVILCISVAIKRVFGKTELS
jgi:ABC-type sugar transport system permease subunit